MNNANEGTEGKGGFERVRVSGDFVELKTTEFRVRDDYGRLVGARTAIREVTFRPANRETDRQFYTMKSPALVQFSVDVRAARLPRLGSEYLPYGASHRHLYFDNLADAQAKAAELVEKMRKRYEKKYGKPTPPPAAPTPEPPTPGALESSCKSYMASCGL